MDNTFLYFLLDASNRSYHEDANGAIKVSAAPVPLKNKPIGWKEIETSIDLSKSYFGNVKALSVPMQYVLDGAQILRYLLYKGKGYESEVYSLVMKYNSQLVDPNGKEGVYEIEYYGKIDMLNLTDEPEIGITVNAKEPGLQSDLDANEDVTYEIPLDQTNLDCIQVLFDGIDLYDKYNYENYEIDVDTYSLLPIIFMNNEGDSVGIIGRVGQSYEIGIGDLPTYAVESSNYIIQSVNPIQISIAGNIIIRNNSSGNARIDIEYYSKSIAEQNMGVYNPVPFTGGFNITILPGETKEINFSTVQSLTAGDKAFIFLGAITDNNNVTILSGKTSISFKTRNDPSLAWCLPPLPHLQQLTARMTGDKYTAASSFFSAHSNIVCTSGQALRGLPNAVLKNSFKSFFEDYNNIYCLSANVVNNVLHVHERKTRYQAGTSTIVFDLGTVSDFKIKPDAANVINTVKTGWPKQEYNERNGRYEFNTEVEWKLPVTSKKGELNLIGKGRGDAYGNEFDRGRLNNKNTTDSKGDNDVRMINVEAQAQISGILQFTYSNQVFTFGNQAGNISFFPVGKVFVMQNTILTVVSSNVDGTSLVVTIKEAPSNFSSGISPILFPYRLKRVQYNSMTGVPVPLVDGIPRSDAAGAVYNVEEMTPKRKLQAWGSYLRSILFQLPGEKINFQTSEKNKDLSTTLNGVTITEKADILVSKLDAPFFLNYRGIFTTQVPLTFSKTLTNLNSAGNVKIRYNGFDLYFLPLGKMSSKPATNDAQEWELILSANNNLNTLYELSQEGLFISDGMDNTLRASIFNPVHMLYYDKQLDARYKHKDLFDDWYHHRNNQFAEQPQYLQKWETADRPIELQYVTNGLGQLDLYIYDCDADQVDIIQAGIVTNPAVRAPYALQQFTVDVSAYVEGHYLFVIKNGANNLMISVWQSFADRHEGTHIIDYRNSYNTHQAYWKTFYPSIRVESIWDLELGEGSSSDYNDETRSQILSFETSTSKNILFRLIPEWMQIKLNHILRLDDVKIEGTGYYLPNDNKWEIERFNGYPLINASVSLKRTDNGMGLAVSATGSPQGPIGAVYTLEAEAFGQGDGVLQVEVKPD